MCWTACAVQAYRTLQPTSQVCKLQLQVSAIMAPKSKSAVRNSFDLGDGGKKTQCKFNTPGNAGI